MLRDTGRVWCALAVAAVLAGCGRTELDPPSLGTGGGGAEPHDGRSRDARDAQPGDIASDTTSGDSSTGEPLPIDARARDTESDHPADAGVDRSSDACGTCAPGQTCQPRVNPFSNPTLWFGSVRGSFPVTATSVAIADMNDDGRNDLVLSNSSGGTNVGVCLRRGDGSFAQPLYSPLNAYEATNFALADFNRDGHLDIATSGFRGVNIGLGNGDGSFRRDLALDTGGGTSTVTAGDVNGDGMPDLVVPLFDQNAVEIHLGQGDGSFQPPRTFAVGHYPLDAALADFDHDGRLDLAVVNQLSGDVSILSGTGTGDFSPAKNYPVPTSPVAVTSIDIDGDGRIDLAVALEQDAPPGNLLLLLGRGDGTFDPPLAFEAANGPMRLAVSDMNGDGIDDLVCSSFFTRSSAVGFLFGSRQRDYGPVHSFATGDMALGIAVGDLDGDGKLDVATADWNGGSPTPSDIAVLLGGGGYGVLSAPWLWPVGQVPTAVAKGDLNRDGHPDLVTANSAERTMTVLLADGHGGLLPRRRYDVGGNPLSVALADLDDDGKTDAAIAGYQFVSVVRGNGDGTFQPAMVTVISGVLAAIDAGDVNGDGHVDLLVGNTTPGGTWLLLGHGDGTFDAPRSVGRSDYSSLSAEIAHIDPDSAADLVLAGTNGSKNGLVVQRGNGDGTFQAPETTDVGGLGPTPGTRWTTALADFDRDGRVDLAVAGAGGGLVVLMGTGEGAFSAAHAIDFGGGRAVSVTTADVDTDGFPDLVAATLPPAPTPPGPHDIAFLRGRGDGTFDAPQRVAIGSLPASLTMIDLDDDGRVDVAAAMSGSDSVNVIFNRETFQCR